MGALIIETKGYKILDGLWGGERNEVGSISASLLDDESLCLNSEDDLHVTHTVNGVPIDEYALIGRVSR